MFTSGRRGTFALAGALGVGIAWTAEQASTAVTAGIGAARWYVNAGPGRAPPAYLVGVFPSVYPTKVYRLPVCFAPPAVVHRSACVPPPVLAMPRPIWRPHA
jgi:hypothetical protein